MASSNSSGLWSQKARCPSSGISISVTRRLSVTKSVEYSSSSSVQMKVLLLSAFKVAVITEWDLLNGL